MKYLIPTILAITLLSACTQPEKATRALEGSGYTNVNITGFNWFGCDKNDGFHTGFTATGVNGKQVEGVVCGNLFKGATIRVD